ncbi:Ldh family oxidoreductase [Nocardiopsis sp. MG754419]|nr:Ldh family oxidoreductase [Nocardiopsis sp. MG754419]
MRDLATTSLASTGVPEPDARLTADSLVQADQRGIGSHGLLRLPLYVSALRAGGINPRPTLTWVRRHGAVAVLDADAALGQIALDRALEHVVAQARHHGVAAVAVQNSTHYGAGAYWTDRLADHGLIGIVTSTTGPAVAPHGGATPLLGTNPLTIAVPTADDAPLTADMATSAGAYGKVVAAANEGRPLPEGWAVDARGRPTTDAEEALSGALLPFGGAKGSGLSVLLEALAASLTTAAFAHRTEDIWADRGARMNTGHLLLALDTDAFTGRAHTERKVSDLRDRVRACGATGTHVHAPGDPERRAAATAAREGVPLSPATVDLLDALATELGLTAPSDLPWTDGGTDTPGGGAT